jgi:hypothetical protein
MLLLLAAALFASHLLIGQSTNVSTAWRRGVFHIDREAIVERSDIILQRPNESQSGAMPLGNGRLGLAVWAQDGYTAQLNRGDTFPLRLSPGQVIVPGLSKLVGADNYSGRLSLHDGEFLQSGGGMTAITYVDESLDVMVIDVTGAAPKVPQTAELRLWPPRKPQVLLKDKIGVLAETWLDNQEAGASEEMFGSLAAITADALDVHVEPGGPLAIKITFLPRPDGSFRLLIGSPAWRGGDATATASKLLTAAKAIPAAEHRAWWNHFWDRVGLMKLSSPDHVAEYFENLRMIDIFTAAADSRDRLPGGQAGVGDLFSSTRDEHQWAPSAYWHWNLRMQVSANLGAGAFELNSSYFRLYRENLNNIIDWTKQHMAGRPGACVPETMRFNGRGYENETWTPAPAIDCGLDFQPYYNARTISTGAEVAFWIWQQYKYTDDLNFLRKNYPAMRESVRFLLAYATHDGNGMLHTFPSNAHETNWDVHDPTTDISAMRVVFPEVIKAASLLGIDSDLTRQLKRELGALPALPIATISSPKVLVPMDRDGADSIIGASYDPAAETHNSENIGLEPIWPFGIIGDDGPLHLLGVRTYLNRPYKNSNDWSPDPVQAARLGLADEFKSSALALTERYQVYPSGLAGFIGPEFYVEQIGVLADALQNALVQDYDGLIRIAPAWPKDWDVDGTVYLQHRSKIHVQIRQGEVVTVGLQNGSKGTVRIRNPWPGQSIDVIDARSLTVVLPANSQAILEFPARAATTYLIRQIHGVNNQLPFEMVSSSRANKPQTLGSRTIGIARYAVVPFVRTGFSGF